MSGSVGGNHFVAVLGTVALGHPNGLDALSIGKAQQVANGAIGGDKALLNFRHAHLVTLGGELLAQGNGEGGNKFHGCKALVVKGIVKLAGAVGGLAKARADFCKLLNWLA